MTTTELDVRAIPPLNRHPRIFQTFEALTPSQGFVLVNDHDPRPLLYQFQAERPGGFEWNTLEAGPERWRIEIQRRPAEGPRAVTEYLQTDHRRLDGILTDAKTLVSRGEFGGAGRRFAEFACGLDRHIEREEQVLFPAFEQATGFTHGPTAVMRSEHVEIHTSLAEARAAIEGKDVSGFDAAVQSLVEVLTEHNSKEEQILYPTTDRVAGSDRDRDDLVRRMQAI